MVHLAETRTPMASGPCSVFDLFEALGHPVQGLLPGGRAKFPFLADERVRQTIRAVDIVKPEPSLDAGPSPIHPQILVGGDLEDLVVFHIQDQGAAHAAIGADGGSLLQLPLPPLEAAGLSRSRPPPGRRSRSFRRRRRAFPAWRGRKERQSWCRNPGCE